MAANAPPLVVAPGGLPPAVAPQLPHSADPGTITGWILDANRGRNANDHHKKWSEVSNALLTTYQP
jgi:hypothetical protein